MGLLQNNPVTRTGGDEQANPDVLTADEFRGFLAELQTEPYRTMFILAGCLGLLRMSPLAGSEARSSGTTQCHSSSVGTSMQNLETIHDYLRSHSEEIGARILSSYPSLHGPGDGLSPFVSQMLRTPYPAQALAIMGVSKRWQSARNANVIAECGAGKTLIALGSMLVHSAGRPFCGLVMSPPHLVEKWARETFLTISGVRVFVIDDMRNGGNRREPHGVNEVRLRRGEIVREGLHTSLSEMRRMSRNGFRRLCPGRAVFCIGREKAKLSYFWKHCFTKSQSGRYRGSVINPDTGCPIETDGTRLTVLDFDKKRLHEVVGGQEGGRTRYSALWEADRTKIRRMAPAE